jgi:gliding motility-associated-like protein
MKVKVLKKVVVPNAFSPNGDGINDVWIIRNLPDYPDASVKIFDRYGQQVFVSKGYSKPWDGTMQGRPLPVGTYYYIIQLKAGEKPLQGSITIIR